MLYQVTTNGLTIKVRSNHAGSIFNVTHGMVWYGMVWYGMVWYGMVWYGMVWYGMVWYGMVWYGMVIYRYGLACAFHVNAKTAIYLLNTALYLLRICTIAKLGANSLQYLRPIIQYANAYANLLRI